MFSKTPIVALIKLSGIISPEGRIGSKNNLNLNDLSDSLTKAFSFKNVKAVAILVNSPGGSPVQSSLISNRIRELALEKDMPVYCFIEDVAASGGYWLSCAADKIYAIESSIVGSIGVISAGFGAVEAIKKIGIERRVYTEGKNKGIANPIAMILSAGLMLRHLKLSGPANSISKAVDLAIQNGKGTPDIFPESNYTTSDVGKYIADNIY